MGFYPIERTTTTQNLSRRGGPKPNPLHAPARGADSECVPKVFFLLGN